MDAVRINPHADLLADPGVSRTLDHNFIVVRKNCCNLIIHAFEYG